MSRRAVRAGGARGRVRAARLRREGVELRKRAREARLARALSQLDALAAEPGGTNAPARAAGADGAAAHRNVSVVVIQ